MQLYTGCVENRQDPLKLGRCQVRIVGLHTDDKTILPTEDLPWAYPMQPVTSAAISGIGHTPIGPVPGTWVVIMFRDSDQQMPIMLGTIGGIPQTKGGERAQEDSADGILPQDGGTLTDSSGNTVVDGSGNPVKTGTDAASNSAPASTAGTPTATPASDNTSIPTTPPPKSGAGAQASTGIKALIAACDKVGLTTKYAKCALLGIAGGESKWVPQKESFNYNPVRLKQIFSTATPEIVEQYSYAPKKGMAREEFFSFFYGPTFRGKNFLGNKIDADGGKYYGRGFIQLTGRANYERYQKLANQNFGLNLDIVGNPDSLDADLDTSALIAAIYITDRVKNWQKLMYEPGFFQAAKNSVGVNSPDIAIAKQNYYEYFLNSATDPVSTDKNATATEPNLSAEEIAKAPPEKREAYKEDRSKNSTQIGFTDPSGKYPLRGHMNEADTNRLARGIIDETCFGFKDATRKVNIPTPGGKTWSQPLSSYNTIYPYNKVMETESGHIMEFDDSPDGERIHLYHRKGTYLEIDPNGSQLNFIVGDGYHIVLRNNNVYVVGSANVTVGGNCNVLVQGNANIEVEGTSDIVLRNDTNIGVATNLSMVVGQNLDLKVGGEFNIETGKSMSILNHENFNVNTDSSITAHAKQKLEVMTEGGTNLETRGDANFLSGGVTNMDYSQGQFGNGASGSETVVVDTVQLTAPDQGSLGAATFDNLQPPERSFEDIAKFETPDDWETPQGQKERKKQFDNPTYKAPENTAGQSQEAAPATGGKGTGKTVDTKDIYARSDFPPSYKLSKNFTIGQLVEPSVLINDVSLPPSIGQNGKVRVYTRQELVANLAHLAENICEPLYELLGPTSGKFAAQSPKGLWSINSGLRNGTNGSDHNKGRALDMRYNPKRSFEETWKLAVQLEKILAYNQLILEYRKPGAKGNPGPGWMNWIHISYSTEGNMRKAFTMVDDASVNDKGVQQAGASGLFLFGSA